MASPKTKHCPYCGEEIAYEATRCKHCREWLEPEVQNTVSTHPEQKPVRNNKSWLWILIAVGIIAAVAIAVFLFTGKKSASKGPDFSGGTLTHEKLSWTIPDGFAVTEQEYDEEDNIYLYYINDKNEDGGLFISIDKDSEYREMSIEDCSEALSAEVLDEIFEEGLKEAKKEDKIDHSLSADYLDEIHYEYRRNIRSVSRYFSIEIDGEEGLGYIRYTLTGPYLITTIAAISSTSDNSIYKKLDSITSSLVNSEYGPSGSQYLHTETFEYLDETPSFPEPEPEDDDYMIPIYSEEEKMPEIPPEDDDYMIPIYSEEEKKPEIPPEEPIEDPASEENQGPKYDEEGVETVEFFRVEVKPTFQGGDPNAFSKWVAQHLQYPEIAKENGIKGRVILQFTIGVDGKLTDIKVVRGVDKALDDEAVRVVKSSPRWTPGMMEGRAVNVTYTFPVIFELS